MTGGREQKLEELERTMDELAERYFTTHDVTLKAELEALPIGEAEANDAEHQLQSPPPARKPTR